MMTTAEYLAVDDDGIPPPWGPNEALNMVLDDHTQVEEEEDNAQKEKDEDKPMEIPLEMPVSFGEVEGAVAILVKYL